MKTKDAAFSDLLGKMLISIDRNGPDDGEVLEFTTSDHRVYRMFHDQDCCESVRIEDICGDFKDLLNSPIIQADESSNQDNPPTPNEESFLWTFYRIASAKGQVVIRWLGTSNGYYSESVSFAERIA